MSRDSSRSIDPEQCLNDKCDGRPADLKGGFSMRVESSRSNEFKHDLNDKVSDESAGVDADCPNDSISSRPRNTLKWIKIKHVLKED